MPKQRRYSILRVTGRLIYLAVRKLFLFLCVKPFLCREGEIPQKSDIKKILLIRIDRIGDVMVSLAAIQTLKQLFPETKISVLVQKNNVVLLNNIPWIDEVIPYEGIMKTVALLKKLKFDLAVDLLMDYPLKTAWLSYFSKARATAGFDIAGRGYFFDIKVKPDNQKKHMSEYMCDFIQAIAKQYGHTGVSCAQFYPELPILEENLIYTKNLLKAGGIRQEDLLAGIHPGGHYPSQCWSIENFSELADRIIREYNAKVVILGSADEEPKIERMLKLMQGRAIKAAGLPLDKLVGLISLMDVLICNNSGPLHIACAVKTPTVSTLGPTDAALWRPQGESHIVLQKDIGCSPCNRPQCRRHDCMELITVEEMMQAVDMQVKRIKK